MMQPRVLEEYAEFRAAATPAAHAPRHGQRLFRQGLGQPLLQPRRYRAMTVCYSYVGYTQQMANDVVDSPGRRSAGFQPRPTSWWQAILPRRCCTRPDTRCCPIFSTFRFFGREEDAADQVEAYFALQFGSDIARTIIKADAYFYEWMASDPKTFAGFSDPHDADSQRMYNLLCLAYGGQRAAFQDLVTSGWLLKDRADGCANEYAQAEAAFRRTVRAVHRPGADGQGEGAQGLNFFALEAQGTGERAGAQAIGDLFGC